ncbi:MAG: hypothetical protein IJY61_08825 [Candidatus Gastranaerophilales bacterium]|nr:hypothetical protein [Candidatus Gastranaerophilales bacterium]
MNKKFNQYVPLIFLAAIVLIGLIVFMGTKDTITEYSEARNAVQDYERKIQEKEKEINTLDTQIKQEQMKLQSIKPVYESGIDSSSQNLGIYGNMFENLVKRAQSNGLLIRSIEYNMTPENDPLIMEGGDRYNACELKFFLVGTYSQLQGFLSEVNNNFEYLVYVSKLSVTAFERNTDYILANTSITLYSKKPDSEIKKSSSNSRRAARRARR